MDILVQGIYDPQTFKNLQLLPVGRMAFDLRGKSLNLIPFHVLKSLIPMFKQHKNYLIFENDKLTTVVSFLSLLGNDKFKFELQFRDQQSPAFYSSLQHPFGWFFAPTAQWQEIMQNPWLRTIYIPVSLKDELRHLPKFWDLTQEHSIEVILQVNSFSELDLYNREKNLTLSVDLGKELEISFRQIDQNLLFNLSIWRNGHESAAGE
jgi:hypothetical protein